MTFKRLSKKHTIYLISLFVLFVLLIVIFIFRLDFKNIISTINNGSVEHIISLIRAAPLLSILLMILHSVVYLIPSFSIFFDNAWVGKGLVKFN